MSVEFQVQYTEAYVVEGQRRWRSLKPARTRSLAIRVGGSLLALFVLAVSVYDQRWGRVGLLVLVLLAFIWANRIDEWNVKRWLRKTPFRGDPLSIKVSDDGIVSHGPKTESTYGWDGVSRAVGFEDGFLLCLGSKLWIWLPEQALQQGTVQETEELLRRKVSDYSSLV